MANGGGVLKSIYTILRWPVAFVIVGGAGVFFIIGLINSLGYQGTTNLRAIKESDPEWQNFQASFDERAGKPFDWFEAEPEVKDGVVEFDRRLVRMFNYLKNNNYKSCGWDKNHELIRIDLKAPKFSDQTPAKDRPISLSTVSRGVGARIAAADYIKCTEKPKNNNCRVPGPMKFQNGADPVGTYQIPLSNHPDDALKPDLSFRDPNCEVTCAVDYFPNNPADATPEEKTPPEVNDAVKKLSGYSGSAFPIEELTSKAKEGAFYKTVLLTYEILHIDDAGCESRQENFGSKRAIPITIHLPEWVKIKLDKGWGDLITTAEEKIPFNFQKRSPLAGLWFDRALDEIGLHVNF